VALTLPSAAFPGTPTIAVDLATGAILSGPTDGTGGVSAVLLNDFYRIRITATADATVTAAGGLIVMLSGTSSSYTGNLSTIRIFGAQVDIGAMTDYQWIRGVLQYGDLAYNVTQSTTTLAGAASTELVWSNLPAQAGDYLAFAIYANSGTAQVGEIVPGFSYPVGQLVVPSKTEVIDFSRQERDDFGNITIIRRGFAVEGQYTIMLNAEDLRQIREFLAFLRGVTCVFYDDEVPDGYGLTVLGLPQGTDFPVSAGNLAFITLDVLGRV
jgi:hypothetical protein